LGRYGPNRKGKTSSHQKTSDEGKGPKKKASEAENKKVWTSGTNHIKRTEETENPQPRQEGNDIEKKKKATRRRFEGARVAATPKTETSRPGKRMRESRKRKDVLEKRKVSSGGKENQLRNHSSQHVANRKRGATGTRRGQT